MNYDMKKEMRLEHIRDYITQKKTASIEELCKECDVSVMTIHRDLNDLSKDGHIIKVRGGARVVQATMEHRFSERESENNSEKIAIAKKVIEHIRPDTSVFIDAGTTTMAVAKYLPDIDINIFTVAPSISLELTHTKKPTIIECAGTLDRDNLMLSGYFTLSMLDQVNIDIALIATSGFSLECGFTCGVESQMMVKRRAIQRAKKVYVLMDSTKMDKTFPFTFANLSDIDYLVTDKNMPDEYVKAMRESNVTII